MSALNSVTCRLLKLLPGDGDEVTSGQHAHHARDGPETAGSERDGRVTLRPKKPCEERAWNRGPRRRQAREDGVALRRPPPPNRAGKLNCRLAEQRAGAAASPSFWGEKVHE